MRLEPFDRRRSAAVAGWSTTAEEALAWCSATSVPVAASVVAAWGEADDVEAYALFDGNDLVGYGEVWLDDEEAEAELAHLIVSPERRGSGVGRLLARLVAERAARRYSDVVLRVRPGNEPAMRCYSAAGFTRMTAEDEGRFNTGQPVDYVWMRLMI